MSDPAIYAEFDNIMLYDVYSETSNLSFTEAKSLKCFTKPYKSPECTTNGLDYIICIVHAICLFLELFRHYVVVRAFSIASLVHALSLPTV